jgi:1-deoxy-D-xylulose-5-phosphate reductoisomerase
LPPRRVAILGATGSIGTNTLKVLAAFPQRFRLMGLTAHNNWDALKKLILQHQPKWCILTDPESQSTMPTISGMAHLKTNVYFGPDALNKLVRAADIDIVVNAIVGAAGLQGSWAVLETGKTLALANKETLVMAGPLVMALTKKSGARLLPIDSEPSAIFQILAERGVESVERVVLTASGGPFRGKKRDALAKVTPEEALRHPTWKMGPKITIDSATLMNKALEIVEARWLFGLRPEQIAVILHPESIVHSFVEFKDGSVLAQLSPPDMQLPIQYALLHPERLPGPAKRLAWEDLRGLTFEQADQETFPAIQLGWEVARRGGTCGAVLNAANEIAVERFLAGTLAFLDIVDVCHALVASHPFNPEPTLTELLAADRWAREEAARWQPRKLPRPPKS